MLENTKVMKANWNLMSVITLWIRKKSRIVIGVGTFATHMQFGLVYSVSILSCFCAAAVKIFLSHTKPAFAGNFIDFDFPLQFILTFSLSLSLSLFPSLFSNRRVSRYSKITGRYVIPMRLNCCAERRLKWTACIWLTYGILELVTCICYPNRNKWNKV